MSAHGGALRADEAKERRGRSVAASRLAPRRDVANLPESVATDAPIRARTTVKNTTFKPMTAENLLLWRVRREK